MKLVTYSTGINARLGALINEHVIDLTVPGLPASLKVIHARTGRCHYDRHFQPRGCMPKALHPIRKTFLRKVERLSYICSV